MNDHYYTAQPNSESKKVLLNVRALDMDLRFYADAGVFSKSELDYGSALLLKSLPSLAGRVLDLGCGWGALGVTLARKNPEAEFVLSDVNRRAVELAEQNIRENGVMNAKAVESDGFAEIDGDFDAIVTNPPIRAGKKVIYPLFKEGARRLRPGGQMFLVIRKQQGAPSALAYLLTLGEARVIERGGGYWIIQYQNERVNRDEA